MEVFVGSRIMWPELEQRIPDGGSLFSREDPQGTCRIVKECKKYISNMSAGEACQNAN
jgi:hypothetical protein